MAGWSEERERDWQRRRDEADWRARERFEGREERSFDRPVFGERDSGAGYNQPRGEGGGEYRTREGDRPAWQDRDYEGVSPGFRQHERDYESGHRANPRFTQQDYTRGGIGRSGGGRFYGDDGRERIYREAYGADPAYAEGRRFGSREADERYQRETRRGYAAFSSPYGTYSGGAGGYDDERGYGDGGRGGEGRREFEERAREAGEFFRRTGRKVASWFNDIGREDDRGGERDYYDTYRERGARGLGPKGYKRSDERISDEAHQRLTDDPWLDASEIACSVSGGEVTLSGTVESREAKHRAERIVEDLSGVNHVQNNLRIKPGSYFTSAGRGYGDSVQDAQMRADDPVKDVTDGGTGSAGRKPS